MGDPNHPKSIFQEFPTLDASERLMTVELQCDLTVAVIYWGSRRSLTSYQMMYFDDGSFNIRDELDDGNEYSSHFCWIDRKFHIYLMYVIIVTPCGIIPIKALVLSIFSRILCPTKWIFNHSLEDLYFIEDMKLTIV